MSGEAAAKPAAGLSLDLDNLWTYLKIHGDSGWEDYPSYLDRFLPKVLDLLDSLELRITFFVVGQDAALSKNQESLSLITARGHEIGNHSFSHDPWLHLYGKEQIRLEIGRAEESIAEATGKVPTGFRGPGFSWSPDLLEVLQESGYRYDASTLPTFLGPLARAYYFWKSDLSPEEKEKRRNLFGKLRDGWRPLKPYQWQLNGGALLEIPVTTVPYLKLPFHLSYLHYFDGFSSGASLSYLRTALWLCRWTETPLSFLLHPLDLLDARDAPELKFFPGMAQSASRKQDLFVQVISAIQQRFEVGTMGDLMKTVEALHMVAVPAGSGKPPEAIDS